MIILGPPEFPSIPLLQGGGSSTLNPKPASPELCVGSVVGNEQAFGASKVARKESVYTLPQERWKQEKRHLDTVPLFLGLEFWGLGI